MEEAIYLSWLPKRQLTLRPPLSHHTDSSLISHRGNQPPHEFGHCSPLGPGQASFYNSANDSEILFLQLLFDKYINYDLEMTVQSDCQAPSRRPPTLTLVISSLRFLELLSRGLGYLIVAQPILGITFFVS